jgi:hypothetical protein
LIRFHHKRQPRELDLADATRFLEHGVRTTPQALAALKGARSALDLLYRDVLGRPLSELPRPRPRRLLDQIRHVIRVRHDSPRTEECYS